MQHDITKLCADSLRALTLEKYGVKLKPAHAHELGAAFFGYPSKNTMLADTKYPISNLHLAKIVVMAPDDLIDQRRKDLEGLSPELPWHIDGKCADCPLSGPAPRRYSDPIPETR